MKRAQISLNKQDQKAEDYQRKQKKNKVDPVNLLNLVSKDYHPLVQTIQLKRQRSIRYMNLSNCQLKNINCLKLFDHSLLRNLNLNNNYLATLKGLQKCEFAELQVLYARHNFLRESQPFHIYMIPKIKEIFLNQNLITHIQVPKVPRVCHSLITIQVHGNPVIFIRDKLNIIKK